MRSGRRPGFTLMEVMLILGIVGLLAAMAVPRISFYYEPPSALLRRSLEEASDLALSGVSLRFVMKPERNSRRGQLVVEALIKKETDSSDLSVFLGTGAAREVLEWTPVKLTYPPDGNGWLMEPEIVYFYRDGSCTPARISWAERGVPDSAAEQFLLTVTGYCVEVGRL